MYVMSVLMVVVVAAFALAVPPFPVLTALAYPASFAVCSLRSLSASSKNS